MRTLVGKVHAVAALSLVTLAACSGQDATAPDALNPYIEPAAAPPGIAIDGVSTAGLFPPNPMPGHCYARVLLPATYDVSEEKVLISPAEERIEVMDARYEAVEEKVLVKEASTRVETCLLYTSPSPRDQRGSRMPSSA